MTLKNQLLQTVDADDIATEDDLKAHRAAMEEYVGGETVPHEAIDWN